MVKSPLLRFMSAALVVLGARFAFAQAKPPAAAPSVSASASAAPAAKGAPAGSAAPVTSSAPAASAAPSAAPSVAPAAPPPSAAPAAPPAAAPPAAAPPEAPTQQMIEEARTHFLKALPLMEEGAFSAALAEFLVSLSIVPRPNSTLNAAFCLRKLQRYDESLDMYERFLRDFPVIKPEDKTVAQRAVTELRGLVGTIDVEGAEPGALISISGIARGEFPPVAPIRVAAGSQLVRVFKEGYEPYETRIEVAGGQLARVTAKMQALKASGRLKVSETSGRAVDVIVDNSVMGPAPWEGLLAVGPHMVVLRGQGKLGTQPVSTEIKRGDSATLALRAEDLDGALRVVPTPPGALVALNSVDLGHGNWNGRIKSGSHKVEVSAPGFLKSTRDVKVDPGGIAVVTVQLDRDDDAPQWQKPSKLFADATIGLAIAPSFGGNVAETCKELCTGGAGLGPLAQIHAGYERGSGFGIGVTLGYVAAFQDTTNRTAEIVPAINQPALSGQGTDHLRLTGFAAGGHISIRYGEKIPFLARASGGVVFANIRDDRSASFTTQGFSIDSTAYSTDALYAFVNPEVRLGYKLTDKFEVGLGLQAFILIATKQPRWDPTIQVNAGSAGIATYKDDTLTGSVVFFLVPALSARYDF